MVSTMDARLWMSALFGCIVLGNTVTDTGASLSNGRPSVTPAICHHNSSRFALPNGSCTSYRNHAHSICSAYIGNATVIGSSAIHIQRETILRSSLSPLKRILAQFSMFPNNANGFQQFRRIVSYLALMRGVAVPNQMYNTLWVAFQKESATCYKAIEALLCHQYFPFCHQMFDQQIRLDICQETCEELKQRYCGDLLGIVHQLKLSSLFRVPSCNGLPLRQPGTRRPCVNPQVISGNNTSQGHLIKRDDCYRTGNTSHYVGNSSTTQSGLTCQRWDQDCPQKHGFVAQHYTELVDAENFCRNPGGLASRPWCFTTNSSVRWEYCTVCQRIQKLEPTPQPISTRQTMVATQAFSSTSPYHLHHSLMTDVKGFSSVVTEMTTMVVPSASVLYKVTLSAVFPTHSSSLYQSTQSASATRSHLSTTTVAPTASTQYPLYIRNWIETYCPVYNESVTTDAMCTQLLGDKRIRTTQEFLTNKQKSLYLFFHVMMPVLRSFVARGDGLDFSSVIKQYLGRSAPNVTSEFQNLKLPSLDSFDRCQRVGLIYSCHYFNPWCKISHDHLGYSADPIALCRDACNAAQKICSTELAFLRTYNKVKRANPDMFRLNSYYVELPECPFLKWKSPGLNQECYNPQFTFEKQLTDGATENCFKETGMMYRGDVNVTQRGQACLDWSHLDLKNWRGATSDEFAFLKQSRNYCRNPQNMGMRPWCLTMDRNGSSITWDYCNITHCPVDGSFSQWSSFSNCSSSCGPGERSKNRMCDNPSPMYGGRGCDGPTTLAEACQLKPCPVNGGFTNWLDSIPCNASCRDRVGFQEQYRTCTNPAPLFGGRNCSHLGAERSLFPCFLEEECETPLASSPIESNTSTPEEETYSIAFIIAISIGVSLALATAIIAIAMKRRQLLCWEAKDSQDNDSFIEPYNEIALTPDNIATIIRSITTNNEVDGDPQEAVAPSKTKCPLLSVEPAIYKCKDSTEPFGAKRDSLESGHLSFKLMERVTTL